MSTRIKLQSDFPIGTRVRLTRKYLRNTGQQFTGEGRNRWTVVKCDVGVPGPCSLCRVGQHVAVDQQVSMYDGTSATMARHIAVAHLEVCS